MRSIEDIAAEEEIRLKEELQKRLGRFLFWAALGLGGWGWFLFFHGLMGKGASAIVASFLLFALSWGGGLVLKVSYPDFILALLASAVPLALYQWTRLPSFYWGQDPDFWLSVHAGAVTEPFWSPLSYLLGQAACFIFPQGQFILLPELSSLVTVAALFLASLEFLTLFKNKSLLAVVMAWLVCWLLAVSLPFWNTVTVGSGLVTSLGFFLFLSQRALLRQGNRPWPALYLILGLLWSVHPLWGFLGLMIHLGSSDFEGPQWFQNFFSLLIGLTPYLWVYFRANQFFPSWGGDHPFLEMLREGKTLLKAHFRDDWALSPALFSAGWITTTLGCFAIFLVFLNFFKWKTSTKQAFSTLEFWVWVLSGIGGLLSYSLSSQRLGPVAVVFLFGLTNLFVKLLERGMERRQNTYFSGTRLGVTAGMGLLLCFSLVWLPGQHYWRSQFFFPQQHALNLLRTLEGRSLLVCDDPFEAKACLEARFMDPSSSPSVILERKYLNQRWYVAQCVAQAPELLFPNLLGSTEEILKNLILINRDSWNIHWAIPALPVAWKESPAFPTVLTQFFVGKGKLQQAPEDIQYRYDLTALPKKEEISDPSTAYYYSRYVTGFNDLGKNLMNRGLYLASIQAFDRALRLDPSFSEPQSYLAQMYSQKNILEAAQLGFEKTIKTHPQKIKGLMIQLEQAQKAKDEPGSVKLLDEMIQLNTELADAQYHLSVIYDRQGRAKESKALLEASLQLNPKQVEAQMTLGHLMARLGNRLKAEEAFRAVLEINPENKEAQVELWKLLNKP